MEFLANYCTWHHHIKYITEKAWGRINVMRKLKFKLDRKSLEIIYTAFIRPLPEYGDVIWYNCLQYEKQEIEKIQLKATRIATGTTKLVSINALRSGGRHLNREDNPTNRLYSIKFFST